MMKKFLRQAAKAVDAVVHCMGLCVLLAGKNTLKQNLKTLKTV